MADTTNNYEKILSLNEQIAGLKKEIDKLEQSSSDRDKETLENNKKILKTLEEEKNHLEKISKVDEDIEKKNTVTLSTIIDQTKELDKQENTLAKINNAWDFLKTNVINVSLGIAGIDLTGLEPKTAAKTLIEMEKVTAKLGQRAGQGTEGVNKLNDAFVGLQKNTNATRQDATAIVSTLSETGYIKNIEKASEYISLFSRATGVSNNQTINMMNEFTKVAGFSDKESGTLLSNIAKIQKANGITKDGMDAISNSIKVTVTNMKAFGQTDESIKKMVESTAKLVSGFEKVGISAQTATKWIVDLTDPDRIEKNIGLYAQLGVSISDALSGNLDTESMAEGLKDFGQKVKEMGPIAGKAYADAFGVSYKEAIKAAEADFSTTEIEPTVDEQSLEVLKQMKDDTLTSVEKIQETINHFSGKMQEMFKEFGTLGTIAMVTLAGVFSTKFKSKIKELSEFESQENQKTIEDLMFDYKKYNDLRIEGDQKAADDYLKNVRNATLETAKLAEIDYKKGIISEEDFKNVANAAQRTLSKTSEILSQTYDSQIEGLNASIDELLSNIKEQSGYIGDDANEQIEKIRNSLDKAKDAINSDKEGIDKMLTDKDVNINIDKSQIKQELETVKEMLEYDLENGLENQLEGYAKSIDQITKNSVQKNTEIIKNASTEINNNSDKASKVLKDASRQAGNSIKEGGNKAGNELKRDARSAGNSVKNSGRSAGAALKAGATALKSALAASGIGAAIAVVTKIITALDKTFKWSETIIKKLDAVFDKMGVVGRFFKNLLGIENSHEDKYEESLNNNTNALNESTQEQKNNKEIISINDDGRVTTSGIATTGDIIKQNNQSSTSQTVKKATGAVDQQVIENTKQTAYYTRETKNTLTEIKEAFNEFKNKYAENRYVNDNATTEVNNDLIIGVDSNKGIQQI